VRLPSTRAARALAGGAAALVLLVVVASVLYWTSPLAHPPPGCTASVTAAPGSDAETFSDFAMSPEQAENAATIAGVGGKLGMPDHAVTVAIATALQESGLHNLSYGDLDSIGLFQQRPSQGWGTPDQIADPVYAATAFYLRLRLQPNWADIDVTKAAQLVQHSAAPLAYAQWEPRARVLAAALTGEAEASLTCHDIKVGAPSVVLVTEAKRELGTAALTGQHPPERARALGNWLVAHAVRFGIDRVTVNGATWTAATGEWAPSGPPDGMLSLHQVTQPPPP
jgi:hypothetical protein